MKIHFVCIGNVFRSRLAEAYLKSKNIPELEVSSSGIHASRNINGPITWSAVRMLENDNLIPFMSMCWQESTKKLLDGNGIVVFMTQNIYQWSVDNLKPELKKIEIWDIQDINERTKNMKDVAHVITFTEEVFEEIKRKVDGLLLY